MGFSERIISAIFDEGFWDSQRPTYLMQDYCEWQNFKLRGIYPAEGYQKARLCLIDMSNLKINVSQNTLIIICTINDEDHVKENISEFVTFVENIIQKGKISGIKTNSKSQLNFLFNLGESHKLKEAISKSQELIVLLQKEDLLDLGRQVNNKPLHSFIDKKNIPLGIISPYKFEGPIQHHMFFGREQEIDRATNKTDSNFAVVSGRGFGKTSLLYELKRKLELYNDSAIYYMSCMNLYTDEVLVQQFTSLVNPRESARMTPHKFKDFLRREYKRTNRSMILLFDETDYIFKAAYDSHNWAFFDRLRDAHTEGFCRIITTGYKWLYRAAIDTNLATFNFFERIILHGLEQEKARDLINKPLNDMGIAIEEEAVTYILEETGCHPRFIQFYCHQILTLIENQKIGKKVGKEEVQLIEDSSSLINYISDVFILNTSTVEQLISLMAAQKCHESGPWINALETVYEDLQKDIKVGPSRFTRELHDLQLAGIFNRKGDSISFTYPFLPKLLCENLSVPLRIKRLKEIIKAKGWNYVTPKSAYVGGSLFDSNYS